MVKLALKKMKHKQGDQSVDGTKQVEAQENLTDFSSGASLSVTSTVADIFKTLTAALIKNTGTLICLLLYPMIKTLNFTKMRAIAASTMILQKVLAKVKPLLLRLPTKILKVLLVMIVTKILLKLLKHS